MGEGCCEEGERQYQIHLGPPMFYDSISYYSPYLGLTMPESMKISPTLS